MTERWFVLEHTPGPALADGESIFAHPMFPQHLAFLEELAERDWLVGAGPIDAERGHGMAVVRIPSGGATLDDVAELAQTADRCVAEGYLSVRVRPWDVRLTGG